MDILGWGDAIASSVNDPRLREAMGNAVWALHSMAAHDAADIGEWERPVPDDQVCLFSDSVIISYPLRHRHDITRMIRQVGSYQTMMLTSGFVVRGGITTGRMFHEQTMAFGPALLEAISLERLASVPRIIVDKKLNSDVISAAKRFPPHWSFVCKDDDGFYSPDYLMPIALSDSMRGQVSHWIERKLAEFKDNERVLPKYEWLSRKFGEAIADAPWRRDIHRANDALMQDHLRRMGSGPRPIDNPNGG
jgi:hypothetical protein